MNLETHLQVRLEDSLKAMSSLRPLLPNITKISELMIERLRAGTTIYTAGNGGSAAQALHLAEELIGRYRANRGPLRAICLNADPTALTCIANDFGFEEIFARQVRGLASSKDILIVLSTSGASANIVNALRAARDQKCVAIGLLGKDGGAAKALCDHAIVVPATDSAHIQDAHQIIIHLLCEAAEIAFSTR